MVIDASVCIGCNACVVSCQAENNVAVVGPEEVARGRDMHWLRVDVYDHGSDRAAEARLPAGPLACIASTRPASPCVRWRPRCMIAKASTFRFTIAASARVSAKPIAPTRCAASISSATPMARNTPISAFESYRGQKNPEVTVRARGVMEKCTYCVQRISAARRNAEREDRAIGLDEVKTACQSACPTNAITFGDLHQKNRRQPTESR
jgi:Fe-S-cluster-containing hydrogenase components 1